MPFTLAIDFGSKHIGLSLVLNEKDGRNTPLFAGVLKYEKSFLNKKVEPRAEIRRIRRTRKARRVRLRRLHEALVGIGVPSEQIPPIIRFCVRRGYKSLWEVEEKFKNEFKGIVYHYGREEFFAALKTELEGRLSEQDARLSLLACEQILNRSGDRRLEIRSVRVENRGVSRCAWDGCDRVTPRRANAVRDPIAQLIFTVYKDRISNDPQLRAGVDAILDRIAELGRRYHSAAGADPAAERKTLMKRISAELASLKRLHIIKSAASPNKDQATREWKYIKINLKGLITRQERRNRFCRDHHSEYVDHLINGKPIPFKQTLLERDILSRREEILFQKLWRYIEARLLSLAPYGIDRVVVERTAFDLLSGTQKQRQKLNEKALEDIYRQGPRHGYTNDLDMLKEEFAGLCAYCGKPAGRLIVKEHILPEKAFHFDSYLNIVPACKTCNGSHSERPAGLHIHDAAYDAFSTYFRIRFKTKPPHIYHRIKKGLLNLMRQPGRLWAAEDYLALICNQLTDITPVQRSPLALARYLGGKLRSVQAQHPRIEFRSGRHTEIWRRAAYPEFDKLRDAEEGGLLTRALNALILASDLPPVETLKASHLRAKDWNEWQTDAMIRAPKAGSSGIPHLKLLFAPVPGFEEIITGNFVLSDLSLFNWNRKDSGTHKQDPYGWCRPKNCPYKRKKAAELAAGLSAIDKAWYTAERKHEEVNKLINQVAHPNLRTHLKTTTNCGTPGQAAADALVQWLRVSIKNSLSHSDMSTHPGDRARNDELAKFSDGGALPPIIGIRKLYPMRTGNVDLCRGGSNGEVTHWYQTDPANIGYVLAYPSEKGIVDRKNPIIVEIRQSGALRVRLGKEHFPDCNGEYLWKGRTLGLRNGPCPIEAQSEAWSNALEIALRRNGMFEYGIITQGCVLKYLDSRERFIRNFSGNYGFRNEALKNVVALKRTPFVQKFQNLISLV
jgi:hypothetical protein